MAREAQNLTFWTTFARFGRFRLLVLEMVKSQMITDDFAVSRRFTSLSVRHFKKPLWWEASVGRHERGAMGNILIFII